MTISGICAKSAKRRLAVLGLIAGLLAPGAHAADYQLEEVATGLDHPWSLAFLPDGTMLVTEKPGRLRLMTESGLAPNAISGTPEVFHASQGGLLDVVPHPDFAENSLLYFSYAHGEDGANALRVARAVYNGLRLTNVEVLFTATPDKKTPVHYGGRMTFIGDGSLLVTLGEGFVYREEAQKLSSHLGTIIRINDDGSVPQDNPFTDKDGALPEIWTYGHRNPQAIAYDPIHDRVYAHEHGPKGGDELNLIERAKNYGWPIATYGVDYTGAKITPYTEYEGTVQPSVYWVPSIAPAGMTIYHGTAFPEWEGDIFIAALIAGNGGEQGVTTGHVRRIDMENGVPVKPGLEQNAELLFGELNERVRDVRTGPDGYLYLLTEGQKDAPQPAGRIWRVSPDAP